MRTKIIKCPKCNGRGWVRDLGETIATFGIPLAMDKLGSLLFGESETELTKDPCPRCDGECYVRVRA